ncbi:MAG: DUF3467 domain-containing protein [Phycisphaerales bacterium]
MADPQPNDPQNQVRVTVDRSKMTLAYSNLFTISNQMEGVFLDFGLYLQHPGPQGQSAQAEYTVGSRVVLPWPAAKRLMATLQQSLKAYEDRFGEVPMPRWPGDQPNSNQPAPPPPPTKN